MTDYKEIDRLLDKYWGCATSVEEERQLRLFFTREVVPPELLPYKNWFVSAEAEKLTPLGEDFDKRILLRIKQEKRYKRRKYVKSILKTMLLLVIMMIVFFLHVTAHSPGA